MPQSRRKSLAALVRRQKWLEQRVLTADSPGARAYDLAELQALNWAIPLLRALNNALSAPPAVPCDGQHGGTPCADHDCHVRFIDAEDGCELNRDCWKTYQHDGACRVRQKDSDAVSSP